MANPRDIVFVNFPGAVQTKPRPLVVVSTDIYHRARPDVILALLTTDVKRAIAQTDYILQDWASAGLHHPTAFRAYLGTSDHRDIITTFGRLSDRDWAEVQARLQIALAVT